MSDLFFSNLKIWISVGSKESAVRIPIMKYGGECITDYVPIEEVNENILSESFNTNKINLKPSMLLIRKVGTYEYEVATKRKIPILPVEWLVDCIRHLELLPYEAYMKQIKPFYGLCITCTQIGIEERSKIQTIIEENGGKFDGTLAKGKTTHLIAIDSIGDKYTYARTWQLPIVTPLWIYECVKQQKWVPERNFPIARPTYMDDDINIPKSELQKKVEAALKNNQSSKIVKNKIKPANQVKKYINIIDEIDSFFVNTMSFQSLPSVHAVPPDNWFIFQNEVFYVDGFNKEVIINYL
eukprot:gene9678-13031_t